MAGQRTDLVIHRTQWGYSLFHAGSLVASTDTVDDLLDLVQDTEGAPGTALLDLRELVHVPPNGVLAEIECSQCKAGHAGPDGRCERHGKLIPVEERAKMLAAGTQGEADSHAPRVRRMLDLSTAHLPEHLGSDLPAAKGVVACVVAYPLAYGVLMWVPTDPAENGAAQAEENQPVPNEVLAVQLYARSLGCDYVLFDRDANTDPNLPTWEWS